MPFVEWLLDHYSPRLGPRGDIARDVYNDYDEGCLAGVYSAEDLLSHIQRNHSMCHAAYVALLECAAEYGTPLDDDDEEDEWL
jgi:hypothetical protein